MANTSDGLLIAIYTLVTSAFITYWIPEYVYAHKLFMHPSFTNPDTSQKYLHTGISEISFAVMIHNIFPFLTAITTLQLEEQSNNILTKISSCHHAVHDRNILLFIEITIIIRCILEPCVVSLNKRQLKDIWRWCNKPIYSKLEEIIQLP